MLHKPSLLFWSICCFSDVVLYQSIFSVHSIVLVRRNSALGI